MGAKNLPRLVDTVPVWPYGTSANRHAIDTYLRYHYEQGLSPRRLTVDDVLVPELLDT